MLSEDLFAAITTKSILNQRFATDLNEQTNAILSDMAKWLRRTLYDYESLFGESPTDARVKRLNKLLGIVETRLDSIYKDIDDLFVESFKELAVDEVSLYASAINEDLVSNILMEEPSATRLWAAVTQNPLYFPNAKNKFVDFTKMVKSLGENAGQVASAISNGYYTGMTYNEVVNMVVGTRAANYNDGMIEASNKQANYIVRTATAHITAQARSALYDANDDIVYAYRLVAVIDGVTSDICKGWDGTVIRLDAKFKPKPPFHGRCRTVDVPEIYRDKLNDVAITRAVNFKARKGVEKGTVGQVDSKLTYYEILAKQPDSQIKFALGAARADIFTNSGISPEKFRDASRDHMGRPLTLAEMAKQNKKILEYMQSRPDLKRYLDD